MELDSVGARIDYALGVAGIDRHELAALLGMHYETIGRYIRDNNLPRKLVDQEKMASALGVRLVWLRTGQGEMRGGGDPITYLGQGNSPIGASSNPTIATGATRGYNPDGVRIINHDPSEDMTYDPAWVVPILLSAYHAVMHRDDLEKAREMKEQGKRFRVRLIVEQDDPKTTEPPPPKG